MTMSQDSNIGNSPLSSHARPSVTPQLAIGLFIVLLGLVLTLDRLRILDAGSALQLWPIIFIAVGVSVLSRRRDQHGRFWGGLWIFIGVWLLLNTLGVVSVGFWQLFWPFVMIMFGVNLILQTLRRGPQSRQNVATGAARLFAIMGESKRSITDNPFRGGHMTAFMGGCQLDLRQATIPPGEEASVEVFAMMGGHEIWVPSGWVVISHVVPIMGSVEDKRLPMMPPALNAEQGPAPRLLIYGYLVMGGLTINN